MRVAADTNVVVSATLNPTSVPAQAIDLAVRAGRLLQSADTLAELNRVIRRPKLDKFRPLNDRVTLVDFLAGAAELVEVVQRIAACRDPKDDKFLEVAVNGSATHLVTGDADLLALHPFRGVAILTPADFVALFDTPAAP